MMKRSAKFLIRCLCGLVILPLWLWYHLQALVVGPARALPGASQFVSLFPGTLGVYLRQAFYGCVLTECGPEAWIGFGTLLTDVDTRIGPSVYLGSYTNLGRVIIERDVLIGSFVSIMNGNRQHGIARLDRPVREQPGEWPLVTIGEDSWIGDHAVVMFNVGRHCVVAAGAVVTKPVPDYAIVAGCPAEIVRYRNQPVPARDSVSDEPLTSPAV